VSEPEHDPRGAYVVQQLFEVMLLGAGGTHTVAQVTAKQMRRVTTEEILEAAEGAKFESVVEHLRQWVKTKKRRRLQERLLEMPWSELHHAVSARWALALMDCCPGGVRLVPSNAAISIAGMPEFPPEQLENPWGERQTPYPRFLSTARLLFKEPFDRGCYLNLWAEGHPKQDDNKHEQHECGEAAYRAMWVACCR
jgi:hypothetical protein